MKNVFKVYGTLWFLIFLLYLLHWSDLLLKLDIKVLLFLVVLIGISFFLGQVFKGYFRLIKLDETTIAKKHRHMQIKGRIICVYFILVFLVARNIPLLRVLQGQVVGDVNMTLIPGVTVIMTAYVIYSSFEFSYMYAFYKDKMALKYNLIILMYFILMVSRQYILICLAIFLYSMYMARFTNKFDTVKKKILGLCILVIAVAILMYGFGVMGNMRYGNKWAWNDSSMIFALGEGNQKWPQWIPKEYFWSYIYLTSPLSNFNVNVLNFLPNNNWGQFISELIPDVISNKFNVVHAPVYLPVSSLNVATSFIGAYRTLGIIGSYMILLLLLTIIAIIILLTYEYRREQLFPQLCGILYVLFMSFFTNPFVFSVTGILILIMIMESFRVKLKIKK